MSASNTSTAVDRLEDTTVLTREELLGLLQDGIQEQARKVREGRIRDESKEKIRVSQWKSLAYTSRAYNEILCDLEDAVELDERLAALEDATGLDSDLG